MGKRMKICLEVAKKVEELTLQGIEFREALSKAKELYNFDEISKKVHKPKH